MNQRRGKRVQIGILKGGGKTLFRLTEKLHLSLGSARGGKKWQRQRKKKHQGGEENGACCPWRNLSLDRWGGKKGGAGGEPTPDNSKFKRAHEKEGAIRASRTGRYEPLYQGGGRVRGCVCFIIYRALGGRARKLNSRILKKKKGKEGSLLCEKKGFLPWAGIHGMPGKKGGNGRNILEWKQLCNATIKKKKKKF